jgi:hypothetical protein
MAPWDITIKAGTDWRKTLRWTTPVLDLDGNVTRDASGKLVYEPVDTTGYTAKMQIRDRVGGILIATLGTADVVGRDGTITFGGVNGHIEFHLPWAVTDTFRKFGRAVHDIEFLSPAPDIIKIPWAEGTVTIKEQVTR